MTLGKKIEILLKENNMTQTTLAKEIGCCTNEISRYVHNKSTPRKERSEKIEKVLGVESLSKYKVEKKIPKNFEEKLESILDEKNITIEEFAKMTGLCTVSIRNYINGKTSPEFESLLIMAEKLEISIDALIMHEVKKEENIVSENGEFQENLRNYLKESNLSQKRFADLIGIGLVKVNRYLNGKSKPRICNLVLLAEFFGVSVDTLVGYKPKNKNK